MSETLADYPDLRSLRVALVHDYLNQPGGAEKVVEVFAQMFPGAPLYTSVYDPSAVSEVWRGLDIRTSFMQRITPRLAVAKALIPLYPVAFESFDFRGYDLVLSSTTAFAKGVITRPETCHLCYCNNPTRFLWTYHDYIEHERFPASMKAALPWVLSPLRVWDYAAAQRVDHFIAGSHNASRRIRKYYRRESDVVQPPINVSHFTLADRVDDYFLVVARLQAYKRIDLVIEACNQLGLALHIVGDGPYRDQLQSLAGPTIRFFGRVSDDEVQSQMAHCRACIVPGEEDFGLTPLEVQAAGRPVIAYGSGGVVETVSEGVTGLFFRTQTVEALIEVLRHFDDNFDPAVLRRHAQQFDVSIFKRRMFDVISQRVREHRRGFEHVSALVPSK